MNENLACPECKTEMSFFQFMKAPTPFHLTCSSCNTKLKLDNYPGLILGIAILVGITTGVIIIILDLLLIFELGILVFVAFMLEVALYLFAKICNFTLSQRES